jgi:3,4-dihydroxy 2-butanone 4-phosphate synthase / GTP cyclohydrolase II
MSEIQIRAKSALPTEFGQFELIVFSYDSPEQEHLALIAEPYDPTNALARIHSECLTGETFHSMRCECREQLEHSMARIGEEGGILVYLRQEGRGIGLTEKVKAYALQDTGLDTVDANVRLGHPIDARNYEAAAALFEYLKVENVRLLSGNLAKKRALTTKQIGCVLEREKLPEPSADKKVYLDQYLRAKRGRMGHV